MARLGKVLQKVEILTNNRLKDSELYLLTFYSPHIALSAIPGQFVEIGFPGTILPKPFSIKNCRKFGIVEILYQVVGNGTKILSHMQQGEELTIIGPLGNGFSVPDSVKQVYLVGGGTGAGPILFASEHIEKKTTTFIGARTSTLLPHTQMDVDSFEIATDDGTYGFSGNIVELITSKLLPPAPLFACGPVPMLKAIWEVVKSWDVSVQFSLETYMGCGVGACLGCQIETLSGQKHVCCDGPVFDAKEIAHVL